MKPSVARRLVEQQSRDAARCESQQQRPWQSQQQHRLSLCAGHVGGPDGGPRSEPASQMRRREHQTESVTLHPRA